MFTARIITQNAATVAEYFKAAMSDDLRREQYYADSSENRPIWSGKVAEQMGILGTPVTPENMKQILDGYALNGRSFVQSQKTNRRSGFDIVCTPNKSVSILSLFDPRIRPAFRAAADAAFLEIEKRAAVRLRNGGLSEDENTQKLLWSVFEESDSRTSDINLHRHYVVANVSIDSEGNYKALQPQEIYLRMGRFFTEIFRNELCRNLRHLGYGIRNTRQGFEIDGVSDELCARFSNSGRNIKAAAQQMAARLGRGGLQDISNNELAVLAREVKAPKRKMSAAAFMAHQFSRLSEEEVAHLKALVKPEDTEVDTSDRAAAAAACQYAVELTYERSCCAKTYEVAATAMREFRGHFSFEQIKAEFNRKGLVRDIDLVTTKEHVRLERRLLDYAANGIRKLPSLGVRSPDISGLSTEQRAMVETVLGSLRSEHINLTLVQGSPGAGKSHVLQRIAACLESEDLAVCAPTNAAVDVLERDGLPATTLHQFLINPPANCRVLLLDEASLLGTRDAARLVEFAEPRGIRLVLVGDSKQNRGFGGSPFEVLLRHSQARRASLDKIQRQTNPEYRSAIQEMTRGDYRQAEERLRGIGAFLEEPDGAARRELVATEYCRMAKLGTVCAVAFSWNEIRECTAAIRRALREKGAIGPEDTFVETLRALDMTEAQKRRESAWTSGALVQIVMAKNGARKGACGTFCGVFKGGIGVEIDGRLYRLPPECVQAVERVALPIASGDKLLFQANAVDVNGRKITRGRTDEVERLNGSHLLLKSGRVIDVRKFKNFTHGFVRTSYSAQGETADSALVIHERGMTQRAFYVSASRGKREIRIITEELILPREDSILTATAIHEHSSQHTSKSPRSGRSREHERRQFLRDSTAVRRHARTGSDTAEELAILPVDALPGASTKGAASRL